MLSRTAEALFWIGRYVERAEDNARLLDVHFHLVLEDPDVAGADSNAVLASVMGVGEDAPHDTYGILEHLGYDASNPNSIVGSLQAARDNARGAREALSAEIWESLNTTYHELSPRVEAARAFGPAPFFSYIRERAATLIGHAESTMSRDHGYDFMVLGRSVERVDMTARLLSARVRSPMSSEGWIPTLRACSAHEAYLWTYQRAVEPQLVLEFLLLDRLFPRSVYHALVVGEQALQRLTPTAGRGGSGDEARLAIGRARTELEFVAPDVLFVELPERLHELQRAMFEVNEAVSRRFFVEAAAVEWVPEESWR